MIYTLENTVFIGIRARVFVNGNLIDRAIRADTVRGEVLYYPDPIRINRKSGEIYTRKLKGFVHIEIIK